MPKFKPNTSAFKMKGYTYAGTSPLQKDVTMWDANGNRVIVDDKELGKSYYDDDLDVNWRDHNFKDAKGKDQHQILYENKPGGSKKGDPVVPSNKPIEYKPNLA